MSIVASTVLTPYEYAQELLELCNTALGETDAGEIERRYVDWERPQLIPNCDQLIVSGWGLGEAPMAATPSGASKRHIRGRVNLVGFLITVGLTCAPNFDGKGNPPAPAALNAAGSEIMQAGWKLWTKIYTEKRDDNLFGGRCTELYMDYLRPLPTQGTLKSFELLIRSEIYGIIAA